MNVSLPEIWRLSFVLKSGGECCIHGPEERLRSARDRWAKARVACDGTEPDTVTIEGVMNTADRSDTELTIVTDDIQAVFLTRLT
jgi:hypothetical protein